MQHDDDLSGTYFPWHWRNLKPVLERASAGIRAPRTTFPNWISRTEHTEEPLFIDYKMKEKWNFNLEFIQDKDCSKLGKYQIFHFVKIQPHDLRSL